MPEHITEESQPAGDIYLITTLHYCSDSRRTIEGIALKIKPWRMLGLPKNGFLKKKKKILTLTNKSVLVFVMMMMVSPNHTNDI